MKEQFDIMSYVRLVLKNWKKVLVWALAGAVFGLIIGISTPRTYTSKAVLAPEIATRSSLGGLSSLASLAGVNMNTMAITDAMHPDMYPEIIHSTNFYIQLFDLPVEVETRDSVVHTDLYTYMLDYYKKPWWGYVLGFPMMAAHGVKNIFSKKSREEDLAEEELELTQQHPDSLRLTRKQERVVKRLAKSIKATVQKKTYVLSLKVTMQDPVIAAQVANAVIEKLTVFVVSYRTEKARENRDYYQKIYDETRADYLAAQKAYSYYMDTHQGLSGRSNLVYQQQLQNEAQLRYQMYSQTAQNLLNAEAKVQQEAPVLVVIQPGIAPHIGKPSKVKLIITYFILGALLCCGWICWRKR